MNRRRTVRTLRDMASSAFLPELPGELITLMECQGLTLSQRTRPRVTLQGLVLVRLVWRHRENGYSVVLNWKLRGALPDGLIDALYAIEPEQERARA